MSTTSPAVAAKTTVKAAAPEPTPQNDVAKVAVKPVIRDRPVPSTEARTTEKALAAHEKAQDRAKEQPPQKIGKAPEGSVEAEAKVDEAKPKEEGHLRRIAEIEREKREAITVANQLHAEKQALLAEKEEQKKFEEEVKRDPRKALQKFGLSYKQLTDIIMNHGLDGELPPEVVDPKVAKLQKELEDQKANQTAAEQARQRDQAAGQINRYLKSMADVIYANKDEFECTVRRIDSRAAASDPVWTDKVSEDAIQLAQMHFKETGKEPTPQFIAETLERLYEEEDLAVVKSSKKVKLKLGIKDESEADEAATATDEPAEKVRPGRHTPKITHRDGGKVSANAGTVNRNHAVTTIGRRMTQDRTGAGTVDLNSMSKEERIAFAIEQANKQMASKGISRRR